MPEFNKENTENKENIKKIKTPIKDLKSNRNNKILKKHFVENTTEKLISSKSTYHERHRNYIQATNRIFQDFESENARQRKRNNVPYEIGDFIKILSRFKS